MAADDVVELTFSGTGYSIRRLGFTHFGHISVTGDEIIFSGVEDCAGEGIYRWAIADGVLTFTTVGEPDPCPRLVILQGHPYEMVPD
jgi:hypothetical protein